MAGAGGEGGSGRGRRKRWWPARLDPAGEVLAGKAGGQGGGGRRPAGVPIWIERERKEREMWWGEVGIRDRERERRGGVRWDVVGACVGVRRGCVRGCASDGVWVGMPCHRSA